MSFRPALLALLLLNACTVGTVTASSKYEPGVAFPSPAAGREPSSPNGAVERADFAPAMADRVTSAREPLPMRLETDCWQCGR